MTVRELREKYLQFFRSKGHDVYPSGSLIPVDVTGRLDESLLFNGAGMVQFKPYFRGVAEPPNRRLTTAQKCVRTGDIEDVGNLTHLTFFEMLGNFSFGDYFKREAIAYSWEFLTSKEWLGLDPNRLSFTVFEEDDEAFNLWAGHFETVGIDGKYRIFRLGEETNYWPAGAFSSGPPGPCGPNSEMFYWTSDSPAPGEGYTREDWLKDDAARNWLEIWNDVFIQFEWQGKLKNPERPAEGYEKTGMPALPFRSVDTGMGLERTAAVLAGFRSVYDTDAFEPIIRKIEGITGDYRYGSDEAKDTATRIIADHIRTACFCIADGVLPGNSGRGYVLRRLIRRAVLKGQRVLGFEEPFFHMVYEGVVEAMGHHYTELTERREMIVETLKGEEALFRRTLDHGLVWLELTLAKPAWNTDAIKFHSPDPDPVPRVVSGHDAFKLHDTYGFPLEVTKEIAEERGFTVDLDGYEAALKEAQERSRGGSDRESVYGGVQVTIVAQIIGEDARPTPTEFLGYQSTRTQTQIAGAIHIPGERDAQSPNPNESNHWPLAIALKETPFYAESGGQVADTGLLIGSGFEGKVTDVIKQDGVFIHEVEPIQMMVDDPAQLTGLNVEAEVDTRRRARITRNHTATHLLHAALREVLGKHVTQAGSYVGPDRLRFDFTHGHAMSEEQRGLVERIVNYKILENAPVTIYNDLPIAEAKAMGAMALFGEKYGDFVRLVQVGDERPADKSFSRELCGGIHVRTTGEIGLFKIIHEASAASGVRRIEALTGEGAYEWVLEQIQLLKDASEKLKTSPKDLLQSLDKHLDAQRDLKQKLEKARTQSAGDTQGQVHNLDGVELVTINLGKGDQADASLAVDRAIEGRATRVALAAVTSDGKVLFVCKVGNEALTLGAHAGNLLREVAKVAGGGGGGRAEFATAGGKDPAKVAEALTAGETTLRSMLK